jgi:3-deoxy-D-manno-octulosonate 8-phosphate phosphatase KdsC-like HAD superfamily phosphatase
MGANIHSINTFGTLDGHGIRYLIFMDAIYIVNFAIILIHGVKLQINSWK